MLADRVRIGIYKSSIPEYTLATDDDFYGSSSGEFRYIGTDEYVIIPNIIKGKAVLSYYRMFGSRLVKGVASNNTAVTNMSYMFYDSSATTLDLSGLNASKVTDMSYMFYDSSATTLDLSGFNTSSVTTMDYMFSGSSATALDLSSFNTSKVTKMSGMFRDSSATALDLSSFNTRNVASMYHMFSGSSATTLDLSSFNTSSVTTMGYMFSQSKATTGYARTQAEANKFNASSNKPAGLTFIVKP